MMSPRPFGFRTPRVWRIVAALAAASTLALIAATHHSFAAGQNAERKQAGRDAPSSRRIGAGDLFHLDIHTNLDAIPNQPVRLLLQPSLVVKVPADGIVSLGVVYGSVRLLDKSPQQAEELVAQAIREGTKKLAAANPSPADAADLPGLLQVNVRATYLGHESPDQLSSLAQGALAPPAETSTIVPGDVLQIEAIVDGLNTRRSVVERDGNIALGARWGRVNVGGKTLLEAESVIRAHIAKNLQDPEVQVVYAGHSSDGAVPGPWDATGAGKTIEQLERGVADLKAMLREIQERKP